METVDIIKNIVSEIDLTIPVNSIVDNGGGSYTINVCSTLHLQEGFPITIDGNVYTITTIVNNESVTLSGTVLPNVTEFEAYPVFYFHGTVIKVKDDMKAPDNSHDLFTRTPFIYLKEIIKDKNYRGRNESPLDRETDLRLFFLTQAKFEDWSTVDHYEKSIAPMRNLVNAFISALSNNTLIGNFEDEPDETTPHVNFGVYVDAKGHTQSVFVDHLSGIELALLMPVLKQDNCNICN